MQIGTVDEFHAWSHPRGSNDDAMAVAHNLSHLESPCVAGSHNDRAQGT
jgi:hypothetical protein